jgi:predicted Zn-dependent peptidase
MTRAHRSGAVALVLLATGIPLATATNVHARAQTIDEALESSPPLTLDIPEPETFDLGNGIRVFHLENRRLPLVTVRALVRTGAVWEPSDQQGVANLTGAMMRDGGTQNASADEVDEQLDFLAATLTTAIGSEQGNVTLNVLSENLAPALAIFGDVLRRPAFEDDRMAVQKNLIKEGIRRQNDNPVQVGIREFTKLLWGAEHPRARTATEASVDALTRDNLVAFHGRYFDPQNVMIGVAGDVSRKEIRKLLEKQFGDWRGGMMEYPDLPAPPPVEARVALAAKAVPQTTILLGHLGPRETDDMRASGEVMMHILGSGGFTSYITDTIRNDAGLAYVAAGFLSFGQMDPGVVVGIALSKASTTCQAADLLIQQFERIQNEDVTDEELDRARNAILNSQAFDYDTPEAIVGKVLSSAYYSLPPGHDERIVEEVGQVTKADVQAAARALLHPDRLSCLAVGDPAQMDCAWSTFAERLGVPLVEIELE